METLLRAGLSNAVAATLMALLVACLRRPLARRPAIRHGLWVLVLVKLITPPIYEIPIPWRFASAAPARLPLDIAVAEAEGPAEVVVRGNRPIHRLESTAIPVEILATSEDRLVALAPHPTGSTVEPPSFLAAVLQQSRWIGAAWLGGSAVVLLLSLRRIRRFQRALTMAREASWLEQEWVDEWAGRMGLRRGPDLWWVPGRISPMIWCLGLRPRLVLPEGFWKRLDVEQRSTLIAHELAHLKRGDHLVRLLELLVTALFWWHPVVWWMRGPLREAEEQCCDAWVVWALPDAVRAYAETLIDTLEFLQQSGRPEPLLASGLGKVPDLRRRLTMVMTGTSRRLPGLPGKLALLIVAGVMLPVGATWAQKTDEPKQVRVQVLTEDGRIVQENVAGVETSQENFSGTVNVLQGTTELVASRPSGESNVVILRVDDQNKLSDKVELSGSLKDVIKKLEGLIVEAKKDGAPTDSSKDRIKGLVQALDALKKAEANQSLQVRIVERRKQVGAGGASSAEVAKAREEVAKLKANLKKTIDQLSKAQARLRELGEDPGEVPLLGWHGSPKDPRIEFRAVGIANPVRIRTVKPSVDPKIEVKVGKPVEIRSTKPSVELKPGIQVRRLETRSVEGKAVDSDRLKLLEKRLKDLQDEVDRLKGGPGRGGAK